jgi:multidrug resistance efflux pump
LPDPSDDGAFAEEVHRRTNELRMEIQRMESSLSAETAVREKAVGKLQRQLDDQHDRLRDMTQQVAVSGLPLEMTGIFFMIAGTVLQGIAQMIK